MVVWYRYRILNASVKTKENNSEGIKDVETKDTIMNPKWWVNN